MLQKLIFNLMALWRHL